LYDRLADLSLEFELERPPAVADLLSIIVNREDVEGIIQRPVGSTTVLQTALTEQKNRIMGDHCFQYALKCAMMGFILSNPHRAAQSDAER